MNAIARTILPVAILGAFVAILGVGAVSNAGDEGQPVKPDLKFPTLGAYETEIAEPGVLLQGEHVWVFAPKRAEEAARIVHGYLAKAYDDLYAIVGAHTKYRIVVYHFPKGNPNAFGGTSECVLYYDDANLDLAASEEWTKHGVPHLAGYVEEMAHNFVGATHAQFGWEMIGWSIGAEAYEKVAANPILERELAETRRKQDETFARYKALGCVFPPDIEPNLVDRIHAHILRQCEQEYGPRFWPDFFAEVRKDKERLADAARLGDGDPIRNERYRITVECFDRLPGLGFKKMLEENGISLRVDAKSLRPTKPGWDRRLREPRTRGMAEHLRLGAGLGSGIPPARSAETLAPRRAAASPATTDSLIAASSTEAAETIPDFDSSALSPLHKAAYEGRMGDAASAVEGGASVQSQDANGWTPLHMAAMGGHQQTCERLLEKGADPFAKDLQGRTPADLARIRGHNGTAELLRRKMTPPDAGPPG